MEYYDSFGCSGAQQEQAADGFGRGSGEWRWRRGDGEGSHAHCVSLRLRGGRGRGDRGDKFNDDTSLSIYRGTMPQDISSEDEDHHLVESLSTRNHVSDHKDATELEKVVKNAILEAKYEDGTLPNPRYMNLTAEEERQLELDELLWFAAEHNELDLALQVPSIFFAAVKCSNTSPLLSNAVITRTTGAQGRRETAPTARCAPS